MRHVVTSVDQATEATQQLLLNDDRPSMNPIGSRPPTPPLPAEEQSLYSHVRDGVFRFIRGLQVARQLSSAPGTSMVPMEAVDAERWAASLTNQLIVDHNDDHAYLLELVCCEITQGGGGQWIWGAPSLDATSLP